MRRLFIALALLATASIVHGSEFPPIALLSMGFEEATAADFAGSPQAAKRAANPNAFLSVTADFNGDAKPDEARLLINRQQGVAYVVVVIVSPDKVDSYVLDQFSTTASNNVGLIRAEPIDSEVAGLTIFALDSGVGEANYFDGEEFNVRVPITVNMSPVS